jgi:hypothetical protein
MNGWHMATNPNPHSPSESWFIKFTSLIKVRQLVEGFLPEKASISVSRQQKKFRGQRQAKGCHQSGVLRQFKPHRPFVSGESLHMLTKSFGERKKLTLWAEEDE